MTELNKCYTNTLVLEVFNLTVYRNVWWQVRAGVVLSEYKWIYKTLISVGICSTFSLQLIVYVIHRPPQSSGRPRLGSQQSENEYNVQIAVSLLYWGLEVDCVLIAFGPTAYLQFRWDVLLKILFNNAYFTVWLTSALTYA